jgi:hypothetical protein
MPPTGDPARCLTLAGAGLHRQLLFALPALLVGQPLQLLCQFGGILSNQQRYVLVQLIRFTTGAASGAVMCQHLQFLTIQRQLQLFTTGSGLSGTLRGFAFGGGFRR